MPKHQYHRTLEVALLRRMNERAAAFVLEHGNPWERWRMNRLLGEQRPLPPGWAMRQKPDGGWAPRHWPHLSELSTSIRQLLALAWLALGDRAEAAQTAAYLEAIQHGDGRWSDRPAPAADGRPAPWWRTFLGAPRPLGAAPRIDPRSETAHTALAAATLTALGRSDSAAVSGALSYLEGLQQADGSLPGYPLATAAWAALLWQLDRRHEAEAALNWVGAHLEAEWDPAEYVTALEALLLGGMSTDHPVLQQVGATLRARQNPRGYWTTTYPGEELELTSAALEVLSRLEPL